MVRARLSLKLVPKLTASKTGLADFPVCVLVHDDTAIHITITTVKAELKIFLIITPNLFSKLYAASCGS
jgi:hypothetical protein